VRQYLDDDGHSGGPAFAFAEDVDEDRGPVVVETRRQDTLLTYALAPRHASAQVLDHPTVGSKDEPYVRRGINIASVFEYKHSTSQVRFIRLAVVDLVDVPPNVDDEGIVGAGGCDGYFLGALE